mgnify:CR=1 FL=1
MTQQDVLQALSRVQEPDLGKDLVTLNMIKDIHIDGTVVTFTVVLTTPACPLKERIRRDCEEAVKDALGATLTVQVKFTANTSSHRADGSPVLSGVRNIIAVVSGKGGVGKSTVSANLALALAQGGAKVGLMDADIYGPSVPIMFGVRGERPLMVQVDGKDKIVPLEKHGLKLISIGLLVDDDVPPDTPQRNCRKNQREQRAEEIFPDIKHSDHCPIFLEIKNSDSSQ